MPPPPGGARERGTAAGARRRGVAVAAAGALLAGGLAACTDDPTRSASHEPVEADSGRVDLHVRVTRVSGRLPGPRREALEEQVRRVLGRYVQAAYLGDYPRGDFDGAYASFTRGAASQARQDRALLTGRGFGDATQVTPAGGSAYLSVLAPEGRAVGVSARTRLAFDVAPAEGGPTRREVRGRLLLTREDGRWRIFGYEVTADPGPGVTR